MVFDEHSSATAFISWNGATDVASYRLYAGSSPDALLPAASPSAPATSEEGTATDPTHVRKTGFETRIDLPHAVEARFVAVVAYDRRGHPLRSSEILDRKERVGTGLYADVGALWWAERRRVFELGALSVVRPFPCLTRALSLDSREAGTDEEPINRSSSPSWRTSLAVAGSSRVRPSWATVRHPRAFIHPFLRSSPPADSSLSPTRPPAPVRTTSFALPAYSSTPSPVKTPPPTSESRMWSPNGEWATMPVKQA